MKSRKMQLSDREILLLSGLVFILAIGGILNFLILPAYDEYLYQTQKIEDMEFEMAVIEAEYQNVASYNAQASDNYLLAESYRNHLPTGFAEDYILMLIQRISKDSGVEINNYSFSEVATLNLSGGDGSANAYSSGVTNLQEITMSINGTYSEMYNFLRFIESTEKKLYISSANFSKGDDEDINGVVVLNQISYAQSYEDIVKPSITLPEELSYKTNKFEPYEKARVAMGSLSQLTDLDEDFLIILNDYQDVSSKFMLWAPNDNSSELFYDSNSHQNVDLTISETNGIYHYSYSIADSSHSGQLESANGDRIVLSIISRPRVDARDQVSLRLNVNNMTSETIEIYVYNDDNSQPRFSLGSSQGVVLLK